MSSRRMREETPVKILSTQFFKIRLGFTTPKQQLKCFFAPFGSVKRKENHFLDHIIKKEEKCKTYQNTIIFLFLDKMFFIN